jgi:H+/Cl- antiporter ClcA
MPDENVKNLLLRINTLKNRLILKSLFVGIISSLFAILYRTMIIKADLIREYALHKYNQNRYTIIVILLIVIINSYIIDSFVKSEPMISGSGIPQIRGVVLRKIYYNPLNVVYKKLIGGFLAVVNGLSVGREGPSIQIGATVGMQISKVLKLNKTEEKYLVTAGASAGLAAAFNAPLSAVIFSLEELHKNFSPVILLTSMISAIISDFISKSVFGLKPVFNFKLDNIIPLKYYPTLIALGLLTGILGVYFNRFIVKTSDFLKKCKYKIYIASLIGVVLLIFMPQGLGGGHELVIEITQGKFTLKFIILILIIKFIYTMISYGSSAPGGIFLPMLVIGALIGNAYSLILSKIFNFDSIYAINFIVLAMVGYFVSVVRAPITGIILITELVGSFNHILSLSLVAFISYITAEFLKEEPIYEILLERLLKGKAQSREYTIHSKKKTVFDIQISTDCELDGIKIKDYKWPKGCLIVAVKRGEKEIIPEGNTILQAGDIVTILSTEECSCKYKMLLIEKATNNTLIQ